MRYVSDRPKLKTLSSSDVRRPVFMFTREDPVLSFGDGQTGSKGSIDHMVASSVSLGSSLAFHLTSHSSGSTSVYSLLYANPAVGASKATKTYKCMKAGLSSTVWAIANDTSGLKIDFYLLASMGTAPTQSVSIPKTTGFDTTSCNRVEAVVILDTNKALVAFGTHRFDIRLSTIEFFVVDTSTCVQLETIIQVPFVETFTDTTSNITTTADAWATWDDGAKFASYVYAISNNGIYTIVANDSSGGRAVQFKYNSMNGLESQIIQVVQISPDASLVTFTPTGIVKIGDLFYMSGSFSRPMTDGTKDEYSVYLTSSDAWNWSVGERSFLVSGDSTRGQLLLVGSNIYYIGVNSSTVSTFIAPARVLDGVGTAEDITDYVITWGLQVATDASDQMSLEVIENTSIAEGDLIKFWAGWIDDNGLPYLVKIGEYIVDIKPDNVTFEGPGTMQVVLLDRAGQIMNDWKASVDVSQDSCTSSSTTAQNNLDDLGSIIIKTNQRDALIKSQKDMTTIDSTKKDVKITDGALFVDSLNDPMVAYSTLRDQRDGVLYGEVEFQDTDEKCQQSFGFVFGGNQGNSLSGRVNHSYFNAILVPKYSRWDSNNFSNDGPILVKSNLAPVYDDGKGGWDTPARLTGLVQSIIYNASSATASACVLTLPVTGTSGTAFSNQIVRPSGNFYFESGIAYQVALRKAGRRLQLYTKRMAYATASAAYNAEWSMNAEFKIDDRFRAAYDDRPYQGIAAATDVWAKPDGFQMGAYGDIDSSLSSAGENPWTVPTVIATDVNKTDSTSNDNSKHHYLHFDGVMPALSVSQLILIKCSPSGYGFSTSITEVNTGPKTIRIKDPYQYERYLDGTYGWQEKGWKGTDRATLYTGNVSEIWGWATSQYKTTKLNAAPLLDNPAAYVVGDPGTVKRPIPCAGKAFFVNDGTDSTAELTRYVVTDNSYFALMSGNSIRGAAWDETSPVAEARVWSVHMNPSVFLNYMSTNEGLPASGYFKVENEIMRYQNDTFDWMGRATGGATNTTSWCMSPTYYMVAQAATGASSTIMQWLSPVFGQSNPASGIGSWIVNPKGLLVEVRSRTNLTDIQPDPNNDIHVDSITLPASFYGNGHMPYMTLDKQYPNAISGPATGVAADVVITSGRGQLGTSKATHDKSAPLVFYPKTLTEPADLTPLPWLIKINSFDQFQGCFNSIEDDIRYTCNLAGLRNVDFRSLSTYSGALSTTPATAATSISDFVLDLSAHLFGDGKKLEIAFRNYKLSLEHLFSGASSVAAGRLGDIRYTLEQPTGIAAANAGHKWLDCNTISVSSVPISGTVSGNTLTDDPSIKINLRIVVRSNLIIMEYEGQTLWTINLNRMEIGGGQTYKSLTPAPLTIRYSGASTATVTARLLEINQEVESHIIDMGSGLGEALGFLLEGRHIWQRSEPDGGILFTTNRTREDWSSDDVPLVENISNDQVVDNAMQIAGHVIVAGGEYGEKMDIDWIRSNGYTFEVGNNRFMYTVQDSVGEAEIMLRIAKEHSVQRVLQGPGILDIQPLDRLDVYRPATGDIPESATKGYVVKQIAYKGDVNSIEGSIDTFLEATI